MLKNSVSKLYPARGAVCREHRKIHAWILKKHSGEYHLKINLQDKQLKQPPAVKQYKIIQAGTLVKSSIEMYVFMWPIVLGPWVCMFQIAQSKPPL
jgi:hypothetical protein